MTAPVQTAGPVDPNAGLRGKLYAGLAMITPLLSFLATFHTITTDQANSLSAAITAVMGALGAFGFGLAAVKTNKQVKDGTFDPAPVNNVLNAFEQINAIKTHVDQTVADTVSAVQGASQTIQQATSLIPVGIPGGGIMSAVTAQGSQAVDDLIRAVSAVEGR